MEKFLFLIMVLSSVFLKSQTKEQQMILSSDQLHSLIEGHSRRIVDNMSIDELRAYAVEKTISEFLDYTGNIDKYTEDNIFNDILEQENGDTDSVLSLWWVMVSLKM